MLVVAKLKAHGLRVTMGDLVSAGTIAGLAAWVARIGDETTSPLVPLTAKYSVVGKTLVLFDLSPIHRPTQTSS